MPSYCKQCEKIHLGNPCVEADKDPMDIIKVFTEETAKWYDSLKSTERCVMCGCSPVLMKKLADALLKIQRS
jgi:hypothetical protein